MSSKDCWYCGVLTTTADDPKVVMVGDGMMWFCSPEHADLIHDFTEAFDAMEELEVGLGSFFAVEHAESVMRALRRAVGLLPEAVVRECDSCHERPSNCRCDSPATWPLLAALPPRSAVRRTVPMRKVEAVSRSVHIGYDQRGYVSVDKSEVVWRIESISRSTILPPSTFTQTVADDVARLVADGIDPDTIRIALEADVEDDYDGHYGIPKVIVSGRRPATQGEVDAEIEAQEQRRRQRHAEEIALAEQHLRDLKAGRR